MTVVQPNVVQWLLTTTAIFTASHLSADDFQRVSLRSKVDQVQPMTGIVLWSDNDAVGDAPIQLEFAYMAYKDIVNERGEYDWSPLEKLLAGVAARRHQLLLRWYDTYVGKSTGIPASITGLSGYHTTRGQSEGKNTEFPDWSQLKLQRFVLDFFNRFAERYDRDRRLAFVQIGFGLWSEYHIYDGPMKLGKTFPSREFQQEFFQHLSQTLKETRWMISVDAAGEWTPFANNADLLKLPFGVFDDSFNHAAHQQENEPNWNVLQRQRWQRAPAGGEFSFFTKSDQRKALAPDGPHGIAFEKHAAAFHISFMIGDDQPRFQKSERIRSAGLACGYRFRVTRFESSATRTRVEIENTGIAPLYYDAFPAVNAVRAEVSLKGLLPGERKLFEIATGSAESKLTIECDRLVEGQSIGFEAELE